MGNEEPIRAIRNIDEAIPPVEDTRVFVDGVHRHGDGGDIRYAICHLRDLLFQSPRRRNCPLVWFGRIQECLDKKALRFRSQSQCSIGSFAVPVFVTIRHS